MKINVDILGKDLSYAMFDETFWGYQCNSNQANPSTLKKNRTLLLLMVFFLLYNLNNVYR